MAISPIERKVALLREGVTITSLARRLGVTVTQVSQVVLGKRRSARIEAAVAAAIHVAPEDAFPPVASARQVAS